MIDAATRRAVCARAGNACEYCGLQQDDSPLAALQIEHILPRKHRGSDALENLALACIDCNLANGNNIAGIDPMTGQMTELFHPRNQRWEDHFAWQGLHVVGKTPVGRATVAVLCVNSDEQLQLRFALRSR